MDYLILNDGELDISVGKSRLEKNWHQEKWKWSDLINKFSITHRTHETYKEYTSLDKERQSEIKDVGGFVGGLITGGRRKKGSVAYRQLITLDVDFAKPDFWNDFQLVFANAGLVYSTHKHNANHPRLRLIIPLAQAVQPDQYQAIGRMVSKMLGIEQFDRSTYTAERLMYWPSTSVDGDYYFNFQDGRWLDPNEILNMYHDWRDTSQWPGNESLDPEIDARAKKQGDPNEKPGAVGAWCRTYGIEEVIETFLTDEYEKTGDGRYTYKHGTTINGVVIYEDKFCYSHHSTDPIHGRLCNSFDLVRIHKFRDSDKDVMQDTPTNKTPSYEKMLEFAVKDKAVKRLIGRERLEQATQEFSVAYVVDEKDGGVQLALEKLKEDGDKWFELLDADNKGKYKSTIDNCIIILNNDPNLKGRLVYNEFSYRHEIKGKLPWMKKTRQLYVDSDDAFMRHYFENVYQIVHKSNLTDALEITFKNNGYHPVKDYLNTLLWDGEERLSTIFIDYLGADHTHYVRTVSRKGFVAAVARVMRPGIKYETVPVLLGRQGAGKSTILRKMGSPWFSDSFGSIQNNKAAESIQGFWLMELGELAVLKRAEIEEIKTFVSRSDDTFRPAYGHRIETFIRQCVFFGTTNNYSFLQDQTGNRRFWPIAVNRERAKLDVFNIPSEIINQLWAEALEYYELGEELHLDEETEAEAKLIQSMHTEEFSHAGLVEEYLERLLPDNWNKMGIFERRAWLDDQDELSPPGKVVRNNVCPMEIWTEVMRGSHKDFTKFIGKEIRQFLDTLNDWKKADGMMKFGPHGPQRYYERVVKNKMA